MHSFVSGSLSRLKTAKYTITKKYLHVLVAQPIDFASSLIVDICFAFAMVIKCNACKHAASVTIKSKFCSTVKLLSIQTFVIYSTLLPWFLLKVKKEEMHGPRSTSFGFVFIFQKWPPSTTCQKAYAEMKDKFKSTLPYFLEENVRRKLSRS